MTLYPSTNPPVPNATLACAVGCMIAVEVLRKQSAVPSSIAFVKAACDMDQFTVLAARKGGA